MGTKWGEGSYIKNCKRCGKPFKVFKCWIRNNAGNFCSRSCASKRPSKNDYRIKKLCKECGNEFLVRRYRQFTALYCSRECLANNRGRRMRGENHPNWKGGISNRDGRSKTIINRLKKERGKCDKCATTHPLHGHHVKEWANYPELRYESSNIMILCDKHHAKMHRDQPNLINMILKERPRSGIIKKCLVCGKDVYCKPYQKDSKKFCSRKCQLSNLHSLLRNKT